MLGKCLFINKLAFFFIGLGLLFNLSASNKVTNLQRVNSLHYILELNSLSKLLLTQLISLLLFLSPNSFEEIFIIFKVATKFYHVNVSPFQVGLWTSSLTELIT